MKESVFRRMKDKSPTKKPKWACLCFHIFSVIDTQDLSLTVVPLTKSHFYVKNMKITPSVSKHWTDSQCTYDGQYCAYSPLALRGCFLYWQDIAWCSIASVFAIKICLKAFYLVVSALIRDRIDQHICQKSPLENCIVPRCQVQTLWQSFHLCIEL